MGIFFDGWSSWIDPKTNFSSPMIKKLTFQVKIKSRWSFFSLSSLLLHPRYSFLHVAPIWHFQIEFSQSLTKALPTDGRTDQQTNHRTGNASDRDARPHLMMILMLIQTRILQLMRWSSIHLPCHVVLVGTRPLANDLGRGWSWCFHYSFISHLMRAKRCGAYPWLPW